MPCTFCRKCRKFRKLHIITKNIKGLIFLNKPSKVAVIGGDKRCAVCAELLAKSGVETAVFGLEKCVLTYATKAASVADAVGDGDAVILPLPVMSDSARIFAPLSDEKVPLSEVIENISEKAVIFAGNPQKCFFSAIESAGLCNEVVNYAASDLFAILGSVPTAEGAIFEAINATGKTVFSSRVLVAGFGRVGKQLSSLLKAMNAKVTVTARRPTDLAAIKALGMAAEKTGDIAKLPDQFDVVFNTVPFTVFDEKTLMALKGSPVIIELASKPYGAGFKRKKGAAVRRSLLKTYL